MKTIERKLANAMTVGELRDLLEGMDEETPVVFATDYGDICHTKQILPLKAGERIDSHCVCESGYSNSGIALVKSDERWDPQPGDDEPMEDEALEILLLSDDYIGF
jgi:hypothetical protein